MIVNKLFAIITRKIKFFHHFAWAVAVSFLLLSVPQNALALTKPTLQSPANNSQITTPSVSFSWSHPYNDQYEVKIKTSGGTLKYASGKTSSKSKTVNLSSIPLTYGSNYIWYVVVYASGQEISSTDSSFTYKFAGRVDLSGGVNVSPSSVTIGQNFTVSFNLKEFQGGAKTFEYVQLWIQNSSGGDLYMAQQWSNESFAANQQKSYSATTSLNPAQGRSAGTYRAIVRGKVAGEAPFNFGVVSGSGAVTPKIFTAVAAASPVPPSQPQAQPTAPAPTVQPKPVVTGRVDLSAGLNVPSNVTIGQNFTVSFNLKEFQGGPKTFEYVQVWIQNSAGGDLYTAQQWSNVSFAANEQKSFSATTSLNPAQGRSAGTYRAIVRGKVAGEAPFNFGVVSGSGAITPKSFTAVAAASPPTPSPSQPQPVKPAASASTDQQKPVVTGRVDLSAGLNVPSSVTIGQNFTVSFNLKEFQGGAKTFEYVQLWIQNSSGGDLYMAQQWSNESFAANQQKSYSATTSLNPAQGRSAGAYRAIVRGKVAGEAPFNFGVVSGSGAITPKSFTAVAAASPPTPSPSQPQPVKPAASASTDQQKPVVTQFDVKTVGGTVTVTYTVTDLGGSGLKQVELWRSPNNRDWEKIATKTLPLLSKDPASGSFPDTPPSAGTYYYGVHVVDQAGNWDSENGPKNVTVGENTQSYGSVSGRLHKNSASGAVLPGVSVSCGGKNITTDGNGFFKLEEIPATKQTVSFSKQGYESFQVSVTILVGHNANMGDRWLTEKTANVEKPKSIVSKPLDPQWTNIILDFCKINYGIKPALRHRGVDIKVDNGNNVYAITNGKVFKNHKANSDNLWDAALIVEHEIGGSKYYTYYGHIKSDLQPPKEVALGQKIGTIRFNHLHISVNRNFKYGWGYNERKIMETCDEIKNAGWLKFQDVFGLREY